MTTKINETVMTKKIEIRLASVDPVFRYGLDNAMKREIRK